MSFTGSAAPSDKHVFKYESSDKVIKFIQFPSEHINGGILERVFKKSGRQEWEVTDISTKTDGRDSEHPNLSVDHYGNGAASQHGYTMCERVLNHVGDEKIHDHFAVAGGVKPWGYWEKVDKGSTEDEMPACQLSYSIVNGGKFIAPDEM